MLGCNVQHQCSLWCWDRINNAGSNAYKYGSLSDASDADLVQIVETNVLGVMLGCREVGACAVSMCVPACRGLGTVMWLSCTARKSCCSVMGYICGLNIVQGTPENEL